jgi:hypothetical protein
MDSGPSAQQPSAMSPSSATGSSGTYSRGSTRNPGYEVAPWDAAPR